MAATPSVESQRIAALVQRLREFGWIESRNLTIEYRYAEGRSERYAELAAEFVRLNVDVIVTYGTPAVAATKQATAVIPIVFAVAGDPIGSGLVASLPRPGGNLTGLSLQKTERCLASRCCGTPLIPVTVTSISWYGPQQQP